MKSWLWTMLVFWAFSFMATTSFAAGPIILKAAHVFKTDFSAHIGVADFAKLVEHKSKGTIKVEIFPAGQLGTERECLEGARMGSHDIALTGTAGWAIINPRLGTFELPFLYRDMEHQKRVFYGELAKVVADLYDEVGLKYLTYYAFGIRSTLTKYKPIRKLEDFKGLRIRVPEVPVFVKTFGALEAIPTPISFGETYTALQAGVVEAVESSPEGMVSMRFYELGKYFNLTKHQSPPIVMAINKANFGKKLSSEQQKLVLEAAMESGKKLFDFVLDANEKAIQTMKDSKIEIIELPASEMARIEAKIQPVYEELGQKYGGTDLIAKIKAVR